MKDFISFAANYHEEIQNSLKVKGKKNRLDLTSYISNNSLKSETDIDNKKKSESAASSEDLPKDLQKLKDLYELEVITEEQFKEAIEKLYN